VTKSSASFVWYVLLALVLALGLGGASMALAEGGDKAPKVKEPKAPKAKEPKAPKVKEPKAPKVKEPKAPKVKEPKPAPAPVSDPEGVSNGAVSEAVDGSTANAAPLVSTGLILLGFVCNHENNRPDKTPAVTWFCTEGEMPDAFESYAQ